METNLYVSDDGKDGFNKKVQYFEHIASSHDNTCLFAINEDGALCGEPAVRCHTIPRASVLTSLSDESDGKVLDIRGWFDLWRHAWNKSSYTNPMNMRSSEAFEPRRRGIGDASVGRFACKQHDLIFAPIDVSLHSIEDGMSSFLSIYRTALFIQDLWRKYGVFLRNQIGPTVKRSNNKFAVLQYAKLSESAKRNTHELYRHTRRLGNIWCSRHTLQPDEPANAVTQAYDFQSKLKFAASVMVGTDGPYVTVRPGEGDLHRMMLSYLAEDRFAINERIEALRGLADGLRVGNDYGVKMITELLSCGFGSVAASPRSYAMLSEDESDAIRHCIYSQSQPQIVRGIVTSGLARQQNRRNRYR